ncbi:hypothetical protein BRC81_04150 [Halobacteriales archaeon QS_1_68_20]|nr:MAG: hypothetical protein BRC81_04150 [Halobacteriales archaeon QS_1_68_20]
MAEPRVPGGQEAVLAPSCGEEVRVIELDMGMREYPCSCGNDHAVVTDVHPPSRFLPEFLVEVLEETVETEDEFDSFGTPHLMGVVMEEFPEAVAVEDVSEDGEVGFALVWMTDFDSRRLHEIVVELVVELMEHAVSHADDDDAVAAFEEEMLSFDVEEFVDQYRQDRNFEPEDFI